MQSFSLVIVLVCLAIPQIGQASFRASFRAVSAKEEPILRQFLLKVPQGPAMVQFLDSKQVKIDLVWDKKIHSTVLKFDYESNSAIIYLNPKISERELATNLISSLQVIESWKLLESTLFRRFDPKTANWFFKILNNNFESKSLNLSALEIEKSGIKLEEQKLLYFLGLLSVGLELKLQKDFLMRDPFWGAPYLTYFLSPENLESGRVRSFCGMNVPPSALAKVLSKVTGANPIEKNKYGQYADWVVDEVFGPSAQHTLSACSNTL